MRTLDRFQYAACAAALTTVLAGCSSAGSGAAHGSDVPRSPTHTAPAGGGVRTVGAGEANNGHTLNAAVGDTLVVTLHSTYWQLIPVTSGSALKATGPATVKSTKGTGCVPGQGCGTVTQSFRAITAGHVLIKARRTSCGEALACTGRAGSYQVTVVVG